jgi:hypothetical protein
VFFLQAPPPKEFFDKEPKAQEMNVWRTKKAQVSHRLAALFVQ